MRFDRIGGAVIVLAALAVGCAGGPATAARPTASLATSPSPSPTPSPAGASSDPAATDPAGSPALHVPVVLDATGSTEAAITGGDLRFAPKDGGEASCSSLPDSLAVAGITALDLGELGPGTLRAQWGVSASTGLGTAELFIDGGDLPEQSFLPFWGGRVKVTSTGKGASGSMTFTGLKLEVDAASKPGLPAPAGGGDWPATLSGSLSWSCAPWASPTSSNAPSVAP